MNVIIRLQNLPWSANASDIRQFFRGLQIPEGGVHIVGGEDGDAFIAFRYLNNFIIFTALNLNWVIFYLLKRELISSMIIKDPL